MRHLTSVSRVQATTAPARRLLLRQAQREVLNAALGVVERILGLIDGAGSE